MDERCVKVVTAATIYRSWEKMAGGRGFDWKGAGWWEGRGLVQGEEVLGREGEVKMGCDESDESDES